MLFATQHWQKQAIISRNKTILMNFSPFMAIMGNIYQIHESSAGDPVHITGKKKREQKVRKFSKTSQASQKALTWAQDYPTYSGVVL